MAKVQLVLLLVCCFVAAISSAKLDKKSSDKELVGTPLSLDPQKLKKRNSEELNCNCNTIGDEQECVCLVPQGMEDNQEDLEEKFLVDDPISQTEEEPDSEKKHKKHNKKHQAHKNKKSAHKSA